MTDLTAQASVFRLLGELGFKGPGFKFELGCRIWDSDSGFGVERT